jgi:glycosyltransferase involved in cell wall biosynthesis
LTAIYICYQSLFDPLTKTQVVAYLEGLAASKHSIVLVTYESKLPSAEDEQKRRRELAEFGIQWRWLRYHKWPSLPATLLDAFIGTVVCWGLIRKYKIRIVHARSHVPALIGMALRRLTNVKLLFDLRGLMAEEYVDAGVWKQNGLLFRLTKFAERRIVKAADAIVCLTQPALRLLRESYPTETLRKSITVIPCCVDIDRSWSNQPNATPDQIPRFVYVGKLGGWYLDAEMLDFFKTASDESPGAQLNIWTQSSRDTVEKIVREKQIEDVTIDSVDPADLPEKLQHANAAIAFIKQCLSKTASSPTKIGEYLAAGLPVVANTGIGDLDELLSGNGDGPVGVTVHDFTSEGYRKALAELDVLMHTPRIAERCRTVARESLDLKTVGWPRYQRVYSELLSSNEDNSMPTSIAREAGSANRASWHARSLSNDESVV